MADTYHLLDGPAASRVVTVVRPHPGTGEIHVLGDDGKTEHRYRPVSSDYPYIHRYVGDVDPKLPLGQQAADRSHLEAEY